ncbi:hypothetical protein PGTUg99_010130 [Puccinia graminis f. sp. tritici]|uniref:CCHC-type domain-containing protein n=1 Tax=Puccinia graminis f. sp. tritici TaxID=56615 RepID=A0A5B0PTC4_PUCGR|nr:hypothetical protein PGTUg99_010130 [Puccinia graminis f. sp. tritici]
MGNVEHSPKNKAPVVPPVPPVPPGPPVPPIQEIEPPPPADGHRYGKEEIGGLNAGQRQWLYRRQHLIKLSEEELMDYDDSVGSSSSDELRIANDLTNPFNQMILDQKPPFKLKDPPAPRTSVPLAPPVQAHHPADAATSATLSLHQETDISKILQDRQAHPALWHVAAAQRLTGKAFRDYYDASFTRTRPKDWVAFQVWLTKLSPLGATLQGVAAGFALLRQGRDETCQSFYERFRDWESKAKSIDFAYEEKTSFVKRLNPGLSAKVIEVMDQEHVRGTPMEMDQVLLTALVNDQRYHKGKAAPLASGSGKRRAESGSDRAGKKKTGPITCHNCKKEGHVVAKCPEPKTADQKAWEAKNAEKKKEKKE